MDSLGPLRDRILQVWGQIYDFFPNASAWLANIMRGWGWDDWMVDLAMMIVSAVCLLVFVLLVMLFITLLERKIIGRMQDRYGPNRASIESLLIIGMGEKRLRKIPGSRFLGKLRLFGIIQPFADAVKFLIKEDITPRAADRWLHLTAPIVVSFAALLIWAVIPFGKGMVGTDLNIGILYIISISSLATIAILMAGWGANNKYALLGALRGVAQMVSYEVPMVLSVLTIVLLAGSMSMIKIAEAQGEIGGMGWFIFYLPMGFVAFLVYFICAVAELNRAPFDIPEGESEIVAGFHIEYSGLKWGLFYLGEYFNALAVAAIITTLFLGGWQGPLLPPYVWFWAKAAVVIFILLWLRATLPRFRVDHLMNFAWRFLLPVSLVNIFITAIVVTVFQTVR
jgi:NADH-quinone oxidoreductase subunit H